MKYKKLIIISIIIGIIIGITLIFIYFIKDSNKDNNEITGIIQIGAHTGEEAQDHYTKIKNNMIWIEAQPDKYEILKQNVKEYGHKAIKALIWNESGLTKDFYITNNSVSSSILEPYNHIKNFGDAVRVKEKIQLKTISYKDLIKQHPELKNNIYNFLILDCQGAEYEVLLGIGKDNLQQFNKLEVEISNSEEYKNQKQQPEITKLLDKWGFKCTYNCDHTSFHSISIYTKN